MKYIYVIFMFNTIILCSSEKRLKKKIIVRQSQENCNDTQLKDQIELPHQPEQLLVSGQGNSFLRSRESIPSAGIDMLDNSASRAGIFDKNFKRVKSYDVGKSFQSDVSLVSEKYRTLEDQLYTSNKNKSDDEEDEKSMKQGHSCAMFSPKEMGTQVDLRVQCRDQSTQTVLEQGNQQNEVLIKDKSIKHGEKTCCTC